MDKFLTGCSLIFLSCFFCLIILLVIIFILKCICALYFYLRCDEVQLINFPNCVGYQPIKFHIFHVIIIIISILHKIHCLREKPTGLILKHSCAFLLYEATVTAPAYSVLLYAAQEMKTLVNKYEAIKQDVAEWTQPSKSLCSRGR